MACLCDLENLELVGTNEDKCSGHAYVVLELMPYHGAKCSKGLKPLKKSSPVSGFIKQETLFVLCKLSVNHGSVE